MTPAHRTGTTAELQMAALLLGAGFDVAMPFGLPTADLVFRWPSGRWLGAQVKVAARRSGRTGHPQADLRKGRNHNAYEDNDFEVFLVLDPKTQDWLALLGATGTRSVTLDPKFHGFNNYEFLKEVSLASCIHRFHAGREGHGCQHHAGSGAPAGPEHEDPQVR